MEMKKYIRILIYLMVLFVFWDCKKETTKPLIITDSIVDIDSNVYKTVKIGNQWWMAENLKVTHYRNGEKIKEVPVNDANIKWDSTLKNGAWCQYPGTASDSMPLGLLYNWYAISDTSNIAPKGWHIPTDEEWKELESYLSMNPEEINKIGWRGDNQGNILKADGATSTWLQSQNSAKIWGLDTYGFHALAGSCRLFNGTWGNPGLQATGFWWTSSKFSDNQAWYRYLDYNKEGIFRFYGNYGNAYSIRCIKDK